jgi:hypothetical protein
VVKAYFDKKNRATPKDRLASLPTLDPAAMFRAFAGPWKEPERQDALIARLGDTSVEEVPWR